MGAAAIGGGIAGGLDLALPGVSIENGIASVNRLNIAAASLIGGLANAGVRTGLLGGSFGDNFVAAIPDIIGQAVGGVRNATREAAQRNAGFQAELNARAQATQDRLNDTLKAIGQGALGNAQGSHVTEAATDALYTSANATVEAEAKQAAIASEQRLSTIEVNGTHANYDDLVSNIEGLNLLIGAYNRAEEQRAAGFNRRQDAIAARALAMRRSSRVLQMSLPHGRSWRPRPVQETRSTAPSSKASRGWWKGYPSHQAPSAQPRTVC